MRTTLDRNRRQNGRLYRVTPYSKVKYIQENKIYSKIHNIQYIIYKISTDSKIKLETIEFTKPILTSWTEPPDSHGCGRNYSLSKKKNLFYQNMAHIRFWKFQNVTNDELSINYVNNINIAVYKFIIYLVV